MQKWYVCAEIQNQSFCVEGRFCFRTVEMQVGMGRHVGVCVNAYQWSDAIHRVL
jgi:hypothetical protein